jgi:hypothetical protein
MGAPDLDEDFGARNPAAMKTLIEWAVLSAT